MYQSILKTTQLFCYLFCNWMFELEFLWLLFFFSPNKWIHSFWRTVTFCGGWLYSWLHLHSSVPCDLVEGWRLWVHLFLRVQPLHEIRRPRLKRRERCSASGAMDYQQKLAEKLIILNERGNGVLIRMNYIKKVRESRHDFFWQVVCATKTRKKELDSRSHALGNWSKCVRAYSYYTTQWYI